MATTIQQAAMNALAAFLRVQFPDVEIASRWPSPDKPLPEKAITIVPAGSYSDQLLQPEVVDLEPIPGDPVNRIYRWRVLERTQPIQLDVWSTYQAVRDDIMARLDQLINLSGVVDDPIENGPLLDLADGWTDSTADCTFTSGQAIDSTTTAQQNEFRALYTGEIRVVLTVKAVSAKLAAIKLKQLSP